ncbi:MAG TPA: tRNA (adenosine(37)-N6)-dimethylallyltransferase MiaA [Candidatus Paceibacterota bacterium]|nr:tRNA (adenosine(37)-N6)-dimethylallyltransferase MiaA [Candidatus Paceibacterota bacterium]
MTKKLPRIVAIVGPTATGKSDLAVAIARRFDGEVISADSRQVYRSLDIGAGKITRREMKGVPHHLLDVANPKGDRYTVEKFKRDGAAALADILSRGKLPIICGGTGFYIDALIWDEQFPAVPPNKALRAKLAKKSAEALMRELKRLDPRRAKTMDPHNKVRIIRAIEIAHALGEVPKQKRIQRYETLFIGLETDKEMLRKRIHDRLMKRMRGEKMLREVESLRKKGVSWKRLHDFGLEYRYLALILQEKSSKEAALAALEQDIAHFAKRQMTWFRRNPDIRWFPLGSAQKIEREVNGFISSDEAE